MSIIQGIKLISEDIVAEIYQVISALFRYFAVLNKICSVQVEVHLVPQVEKCQKFLAQPLPRNGADYTPVDLLLYSLALTGPNQMRGKERQKRKERKKEKWCLDWTEGGRKERGIFEWGIYVIWQRTLGRVLMQALLVTQSI